jgi:hypothetical protein
VTELGSLRGALDVGPGQGLPAQAPAPATELFRLEATRSGNRVAQLRALSTADGYLVECQVDAVDGRTVDARRAPRHSFATQAEAKAFVDEAAAALQYLGCHVRAGNA